MQQAEVSPVEYSSRLYYNKRLINKNAFQLKSHLPLADRKSNTIWPWNDVDLGMTLMPFMTLTSDKSNQAKLLSW